ncbi:MAG: methionine adenosyltransferase [Methanocorpusculum sp.]|jgi:S-adenosylmethionine synthetase|nr:methionine adenosyltransferase [Methanocorpusculum sp.]MDD2470868.1 methionine adenosyltransferase [Methanocorpusculum sp.]MDD3257598.1 methionine adenosyltransferase [Methanocorpusculum sp.]MDD4133095.1 methionine adenosyltransferase [Methanocorpusculum sp.]
MKRNISITHLSQTPIEKQKVELVERKCIGHPDSLADGVAEAISQALCREYMAECDGAVLHHNTDQGEVVAGESRPEFGGGKIIKPIYFLLTGRATRQFGDKTFATDSIAVNAARDYLRETIPTFNMDRDIIVDCRMGIGSTDLRDVFQTKKGHTTVPRANDTSFGVGHAPFSEVEQIILGIDEYIAKEFRPKNPMVGYDLKLMGLRDINTITLTVASAMVDRYCSGIDDYVEMKDKMAESFTQVAKRYTDRKVRVEVNTADIIRKKATSVFLTVNGTSAEMGDDGSVGRGNRCNGLITPNRPMSMEATSGKNPINHIGKIYNLLSTEIAKEACQKVDGVEEMYVKLLSQIGHPIDYPLIASVQCITKRGYNFKDFAPEVDEIVNKRLENISDITRLVIDGKLKTF